MSKPHSTCLRTLSATEIRDFLVQRSLIDLPGELRLQ
jgi:hypothetical protein